MTVDIFQLNWIFIDTVVIILLIVFLVSVKIFKEKVRWRNQLSNAVLFQDKFDPNSLELTTPDLVNSITIIKKKILNGNEFTKPVILFISADKRSKLINILTEGLACYGFPVVLIKINLQFLKNQEFLAKVGQNININLTSKLMDFIKTCQIYSNSTYFTLSMDKSVNFANTMIFDESNAGMILINPKFNDDTNKIFTNIITRKELNEKIRFIFSKKTPIYSTPLNHFLSNFADYKQNKSYLLVLEKSKSSFKFYESILLGIIIDLIESILLKKK